MKILGALESIGIGIAMIGLIALITITVTNPPKGSIMAELQTTTTEIMTARFTTDVHGNGIKIITDTETGVQYLFVKSGYGAGLTILVDENGEPLLKEDGNENGK